MAVNVSAAGALAGGCDSPVRSGWAVGGEPFVQSRGDGAYAYDELGRRYVDYVMAYGPLLFGYNHPELARGLDAIASTGILFGSTHAQEYDLAARLGRLLPSMQSLRFVTTGTEAMMSAIRVARAFTGRDLILRFAGNYHGHFDAALLNAGASANTRTLGRSGIPQNTGDCVTVARYNDLKNVDQILDARREGCAAIVVEPVAANMGLVLPEFGFLQGLRERADSCGALLIFDEMITWPRFGTGGAQTRFGVTPDLTAIGKVLGGGFPIAAYGGRDDCMSVLAPNGPVFSGGTHAGYPFGVAMALRVLDVLEMHPEYFLQMNVLAERLAGGIRRIFRDRSLPYAVAQTESIVDFVFRAGAPSRSYEDALNADAAMYAAYYHEMRKRGILLPPSQNEVMFLSAAHRDADIDLTIAAIDETLKVLS